MSICEPVFSLPKPFQVFFPLITEHEHGGAFSGLAGERNKRISGVDWPLV